MSEQKDFLTNVTTIFKNAEKQARNAYNAVNETYNSMSNIEKDAQKESNMKELTDLIQGIDDQLFMFKECVMDLNRICTDSLKNIDSKLSQISQSLNKPITNIESSINRLEESIKKSERVGDVLQNIEGEQRAQTKKMDEFISLSSTKINNMETALRQAEETLRLLLANNLLNEFDKANALESVDDRTSISNSSVKSQVKNKIWQERVDVLSELIYRLCKYDEPNLYGAKFLFIGEIHNTSGKYVKYQPEETVICSIDLRAKQTVYFTNKAVYLKEKDELINQCKYKHIVDSYVTGEGVVVRPRSGFSLRIPDGLYDRALCDFLRLVSGSFNNIHDTKAASIKLKTLNNQKLSSLLLHRQ
ncbi:MAG: hypothetical protein J6O04_03890 [Selenomonadaceae bacterium]|nr:hypothetical protein [Selenomonadaceae bacterium]